MGEVSKNDRARDVAGLRDTNAIIIDDPAEMGFVCPKEREVFGVPDHSLAWSEYHAFIWCRTCNADYPSCLCLPHNPERATEIYLDCIESAVKRALAEKPLESHQVEALEKIAQNPPGK